MKKLGVWMLILAVAAAMFTVLAGCGGGDTDQARECMEAGDELIDEVDLGYDKAISNMQAAIVTLSSGSGDPRAEGEKLQGDLREVGDDLAAAKAEYQKILGLNGVDDYKTYAELSLEFTDMLEDHLATAKVLLDRVIAELQSGAVADVSAYLEDIVSGPEFTELNALGDTMKIKEKEAKDFKKEKDL